MMGRYVTVLDLQNDKFRYLDSQVRRFCPFKGGFLALEHDVKSPGTTFNSFDASGFKWVHSSIPPLLNCDVKYPVLLMYSKFLLVISGNHIQALELDTKKWHLFVFSTSDGLFEPARGTNYAILGDRLFLCYAPTMDLYCADLRQISNAVTVKLHQVNINLTRVLHPVNFIFVNEDVLVAL